MLVGAPIAVGRLRGVDAAAARALPGVTAVLTAADLPDFPELRPPRRCGRCRSPMTGSIARASRSRSCSASRSRRRRPGALPLSSIASRPTRCCSGGESRARHGRRPVVFDKGDVDAARAEAAVRIEQTYVQAARHHNTMETSATVARWDGDRLTLWDAVQASSTVVPVVEHGARRSTPATCASSPAHTGGGFGAKGYIWPHEILAAAAARVVGAAGEAAPAPRRPVHQRRLPAVDGADDPARRRRRRQPARRRARRRQQRGPGRHARRTGDGGEQVALRLAVDPAASADRAGHPQRADADAGARRGAGPVGPGKSR